MNIKQNTETLPSDITKIFANNLQGNPNTFLTVLVILIFGALSFYSIYSNNDRMQENNKLLQKVADQQQQCVEILKDIHSTMIQQHMYTQKKFTIEQQ
jgi:hypothetical protein